MRTCFTVMTATVLTLVVPLGIGASDAIRARAIVTRTKAKPGDRFGHGFQHSGTLQGSEKPL